MAKLELGVESSSYWESARKRGVSLARVPETRVVVTGMEAMTPFGKYIP